MFVRTLTWLLRYILLVATYVVCWPFMHLFNRTIVIGRENLPRHANVLVIANHATMIDSWFIGMAAYTPWLLLKPGLQPYHLPEEKNFFRGKVLSALCILWRCIPINRKTGDFLNKLVAITNGLRSAGLIIFPEGGRNTEARAGQITRWNVSGIQRLITACDSTITPIGVYGIHEVLPIGTRRPRCGKIIVIVVGKSFNCSDIQHIARKDQESAISKRTQKATQEALDVAHTRWKMDIMHPSALLLLSQLFERQLRRTP